MTTAQPKKKLNKADYMFKSLTNEDNLVKMPGQIDGIMFAIKDLTNCTVKLHDHMSQVRKTEKIPYFHPNFIDYH